MGEFIAFVIGFIFVVFVSVNSTIFIFDANETVQMINEICLKNDGIEKSRVSLSEWTFKCKDGASFVVKRP